MGILAKSGVGGSIYGVVPDFAGFCAWSPSFDELGNTFNGCRFFERLGQAYRFHHFDVVALGGIDDKKDLLPNRNSFWTQKADG